MLATCNFCGAVTGTVSTTICDRCKHSEGFTAQYDGMSTVELVDFYTSLGQWKDAESVVMYKVADGYISQTQCDVMLALITQRHECAEFAERLKRQDIEPTVQTLRDMGFDDGLADWFAKSYIPTR